MEEEGYNQETSVGVTAASSTIGIVIPPSIPMVVYSSVAGASIGALFLGGVVPGILIGLGQMFVIFMGNKKYHSQKARNLMQACLQEDFWPQDTGTSFS